MFAVLTKGAVFAAGALDPLDTMPGRVDLESHFGPVGGNHLG